MRIATEGALWGAVSARGFLREAVIVSAPGISTKTITSWTSAIDSAPCRV